jgi:hypothetical protein
MTAKISQPGLLWWAICCLCLCLYKLISRSISCANASCESDCVMATFRKPGTKTCCCGVVLGNFSLDTTPQPDVSVKDWTPITRSLQVKDARFQNVSYSQVSRTAIGQL